MQGDDPDRVAMPPFVGALAVQAVQDAKDRFSAVVDAALAGRPQEVTRRGRPAVVVLAAGDDHRLVTEAAAPREGIAEPVSGFPGDEAPILTARPRDVAFRSTSSTPT